MYILYNRWLCNIIDQAFSVKMAFLSTKTKLSKVNRNAAKNESNPAIFTEQAWPIKDFIYDQTKIFSFGVRTQDSLNLASSWDQP